MKTHALVSTIICSAAILTGQSRAEEALPNDSPDLIVVSSRVVINSEAPSAILGFILGDAETAGANRWVLIRVVGPALAEFEIEAPLGRPAATLHVHNTGQVQLGYEHRLFPAIVYDDGTTPASRFRDALHRATEVSGAFPVPIPDVGEPLPEERDLVDLYELSAGSHTIQAFARDPGLTGEVLVEVYTLPADFDPEFAPEDAG